MKKNNRKWLLKLTEEQYRCIIRGMEYYHRMMSGQVDVVDDVCENRISHSTEIALKNEMFPELAFNASYGWNGGQKSKYFDKEAAMSYQIYREMEHQFTVDKGFNNVYTIETLQSEKAEPIIAEKINCKENKL